jgi:hypothetical protein
MKGIEMYRLRLKVPLNVVMLTLAALLSTVTAFAQTNTPAPPTAVPTVGIAFDQTITNTFFEQSNFWMDVFAPIIAIGIGIAIALAILTFIGKQILAAF